MAMVLARLAEAEKRLSLAYPPDQFVAALGGFFDGLHWTDLGNAKLSVIEEAMLALHAYDGPAAIYVKASSAALRTDAWRQLQGGATVIYEPAPMLETIDAIIEYALTTTDLLPSLEPDTRLLVQSYVRSRVGLYDDLGDVLSDVDDFILTRLDGPRIRAGGHQRVLPEFVLTRSVRSFVAEPGPGSERNLLDHALLRGDDERLAVGALTASTISLLSRYQGGEIAAAPQLEPVVLWAFCLLACHHGLAVLGNGQAPSWRAQPDVRSFVVTQLCRDFRRARSNEGFRALVLERARDAFDVVRIFAGGDEKSVANLRKQLRSVSLSASWLPRWCADAFQLVGEPKAGRQDLILDFTGNLRKIDDQRPLVKQLTRRISENRRYGALLLQWRTPSNRDLITSAWIKAVLCEVPKAGDACNKCESCRALMSGGSPSFGVARLDISDNERTAETAANIQVEQIRRLINNPGLFPGRRVIVLDGVDRVRKQAIDRLLKAIEEAPPAVSFLFLAERLDRVPASLRSRSIKVVAKG